MQNPGSDTGVFVLRITRHQNDDKDQDMLEDKYKDFVIWPD